MTWEYFLKRVHRAFCRHQHWEHTHEEMPGLSGDMYNIHSRKCTLCGEFEVIDIYRQMSRRKGVKMASAITVIDELKKTLDAYDPAEETQADFLRRLKNKIDRYIDEIYGTD